jgi:hypothetical protein
MYWVLLVPFVLLLLVLEVLKDESPNLKEIFRRVLISILLLYTFDWTLDALATIGDAVTANINGLEKLGEVLKGLGPNYQGSGSWFNMRETTIYIFNLAAYIIAYLGFFVATVLTHFVWTILYVCSPLMILMYVSKSTSFVTASLYKGLTNVVLWKILWSILGVLLLKFAMQPQVTGMDDYLMSIIVNLCIGVCMLFIPLATKSLISDGMGSVANTMALAPAIAAAGAIKAGAQKFASKATGHAKNLGTLAGKPITNQLSGRFEQFKDWSKPTTEKVKHFKERYESFGVPSYIREKREKENNS